MAEHNPRKRSRSPTGEHKRERRQPRTPRQDATHTHTKSLPFGARELSRRDLRTYRAMFALYLDIQKQKDIEELEEDEVKGRWKSFINKWNGGELAEGWYDPNTQSRAIEAAPPSATIANHSRSHSQIPDKDKLEDTETEVDGDEDDYGPAPPTELATSANTRLANRSDPRSGPSIPLVSDVLASHEEAAEAATASHHAAIAAIRADRKSERKLQAQRLEELAPRPEAGSRERQLEKKREAAASNRSFAHTAHDGGDMELGDADVMGEADSLGEIKRMKKENERKRSERELRRDEMLRARKAERDERMAVHRRKEEKTMESLVALARARFGGGEEDAGQGNDTG